MLADNRLTELAQWDDRLLAQQLKDLSLLGLDFSLEVTGSRASTRQTSKKQRHCWTS
jgi:hypothetical protein